MTTIPTPPKSRRGFASMTPERRREISAKAGSSVPAHKRAFSTDRELASTAGRLGGEASAAASRRTTPDAEG